ncbi:MAG: hypothetical protein K2N72_12470 [Oscillospiraceae bacterium]|nr:hypothetical protein [Oscillospiraceae bacterium]
MRVTTKAYTQNYLKSSSTLLSKLLKSENKILSQRKYNRASEDSASAAKASHVRKSLANLKIYDENCKTSKDFFYAAEKVLYDVADNTYMNVKQKVCSVQDTMDQTQLNIVAQEISELADHIITDMNSDFAERQMFGSCSNDTTPFTVHSSVRVFDKDGNEILLDGTRPFGNTIDTAAVTSDNNPASDAATPANVMFMKQVEFYNNGGKERGCVITPDVLSGLTFERGDLQKASYKADGGMTGKVIINDEKGNSYEGVLDGDKIKISLYDADGVQYPATFEMDCTVSGDTFTLSGGVTIKDALDNEVYAIPKDALMTELEVNAAHDEWGRAIDLNDSDSVLSLGDETYGKLPEGSKVNEDGTVSVTFKLYNEKGNEDVPFDETVSIVYEYDEASKQYVQTGDYTVNMGENSKISDDGSAIITRSGVKIDDPAFYDGNAYSVKGNYMEKYGGPSMSFDFKVNGEFDRSGAVLDRVVCYNDIPVDLKGDNLLKAVNGGTIVYYDRSGNVEGSKKIDTEIGMDALADVNAFPGAKPIYVDIGLGINYSKLDSTSLNVCLNGAEITGWGTDKDGDSYNLMQLIYDCAEAMRAGDRASVNRYIDKLEAANTKVLQKITDLGIKQNDLDYYTDKNEVYRLSLLEKQNELEGCDLEEEITNWKTIDAAYNAALSMGSQILPKSLFDFI